MTSTLRTTISGNDQRPTIVYLHGWPDDETVFAGIVGRLNSEYYNVRLTLPNYGPVGPNNPIKRFGSNVDEVVESFRRTIQNVQKDRNRDGEPVTLIVHDWGCVYGYELEARYPHLVKQIVAMDIGTHVKPTPKEIVYILAYQIYLAVAFLIGIVIPPLGNLMTRLCAAFFKAPKSRDASLMRSDINYPYFWMWYYRLFRRDRLVSLDPVRHRQRGMVPYPLLYLYGKNKPFLFHSDKFVAAVRARSDSDVVAYEGGHWFFVRREAEMVQEKIAAWLSQRYSSKSAKL